MTVMTDETVGPDLDAYRVQVEAHLEAFLREKAHAATSLRLPPAPVESVGALLRAGGKRLRPLLCACGWHAAGGGPELANVVAVGAALEMFHAFALIHDDVADRSATRRGQPTVHRRLAAEFAGSRSQAEAERLGASAAILIGDLALAWSDELMHAAALPAGRLAAALSLINEMRAEIMYGQYLDLTSSACADLDLPLTVIRYKTAKYTIERPLQLGAAIAGADQRLIESLSGFALPLGEAFQLRDDMLGIFGEPVETGKSRLDDLREGKYTVLMALALAAADDRQETTLRAVLGNASVSDAEAERVRAILNETGATAKVEQLIEARYRQAMSVLAALALPAPAAQAIRALARAAVTRRS